MKTQAKKQIDGRLIAGAKGVAILLIVQALNKSRANLEVRRSLACPRVWSASSFASGYCRSTLSRPRRSGAEKSTGSLNE
jgi:hypothetical protein